MAHKQSLASLRVELETILTSLSHLEFPSYRPPLIDSSQEKDTIHSDPSDIPGLKLFKAAISRELENIVKFTSQPDYESLPPPSTNALYYLAVWNEILGAPAPILAIGKKFDLPKVKGQPKISAKVDVVAEQGRSWIRVNTTKNSRLLAEFRELDSYITDSEGDQDEGDDHSTQQTLEENRPFDNSILRMARSLLAAADHHRIASANGPTPPRVTMRLTRLHPHDDSSPDTDPRIAQTISTLREMGAHIELGENLQMIPPAISPTAAASSTFYPTLDINLDLSLLIALTSDITHSPLPKSLTEAKARYRVSGYAAGLRKAYKGEKGDHPSEEVDDIGEHGRAVANQTIHEMEHSLLDVIVSTLGTGALESNARIQFWATKEAKERFLAIASKIAGKSERRRAYALFGEDGTPIEGFWHDSRFSPGYLPGLPIQEFPSDSPPPDAPLVSPTPFHAHLAKTCWKVLAAPPTPSALGTMSPVWRQPDNFPAPALRLTSRFTAHTVQSLLWGAVKGMTTLTANKASIKAIMREMGSFAGLGEQFRQDDIPNSGTSVDMAALWIVEPRSLAEGMRTDKPHLEDRYTT